MTPVYLRGPADPYTPPDFFLRFLARFDKGLRLRWSQRFDKWYVERKAACAIEYVKRLPQYVKHWSGAMVENDSWVRARDGYILVQTFSPLPKLGEWTIAMLQWGDPWRINPADREQLLLDQERKEDESTHRAHQRYIEAMAKDEYENMVWRGGEREVVPSNYERTAP